jgi:hypothetical protein
MVSFGPGEPGIIVIGDRLVVRVVVRPGACHFVETAYVIVTDSATLT